jgi:hypothetical protein
MTTVAYQEAKLEQLKAQAVSRLHGSPLDDIDKLANANGNGNGNGASARKVSFPLQWCHCVQDSPGNPCNCAPLILWVNTTDIIEYGKSELKGSDGERLYYFDVANDASLLAEVLRPVRAKSLVDGSNGDTPSYGTAELPVPPQWLVWVALVVGLLDGLSNLIPSDNPVKDAEDYIRNHHS